MVDFDGAISFVNTIGARTRRLVAALADRATVVGSSGGLVTVSRVGEEDDPDPGPAKPYAVLGGGGPPGVGTDGWLMNVPGQGAAFLPFSGPNAPSGLSVFDVRSYGAVGVNGVDDQPAMQACKTDCDAANGIYYIPPGMTFEVHSTLDLRNLTTIWAYGTIEVVEATDPGVICGGNSGSGQPQEMFFHKVVESSGAQTNVCLRVVGLKNNRVTIESCSYLELYADGNVANDAASYYNDYEIGFVPKLVFNAVNGGSLNETRFWGGRLVDVDVSGNHNRFYDNSFESSTVNFLDTAENCAILHARFEGTCAIDFAAATTDNVVQQSWASIASTIWPTMPITDAGFNNRVYLEKQEGVAVTVWRADAASRITDVAGPWNNAYDPGLLEPGFVKILLPSASGSDAIWDSGVFPLERGVMSGVYSNARIWSWVCDQAIWRPRVFGYDVDRVQITGGSDPGFMRTTGGWAWNATDNCYQFNSNQSGPHRIVIDDRAAQYARIVMFAGNPGATWFTYAAVQCIVLPPSDTQIADLVRRQSARPLASDAAPTKSLLPLGDKIVATTGDRIVDRYHETTLTANEATTNVTMDVASIGTGLASGDLAAVELDDGTTHFTTVNGTPSGTTVVLLAGLPSAASIGRRLVVTHFGAIT